MNKTSALLFFLIGVFINQAFAVTGEQMVAGYNLSYCTSEKFSEQIKKMTSKDVASYSDRYGDYMLHKALNFENQLGDKDTNPVVNIFSDRIAKAVALIEKGCFIDIKNSAGKTPLDLFFDSIQTQKLIRPENLADFKKLFTAINSALSTYGQATKDYFLNESQEVINALSSSKPTKTPAGTGGVLSPIQIKMVELKNHLSKFKQKLENLKGELVLLKSALKKPR